MILNRLNYVRNFPIPVLMLAGFLSIHLLQAQSIATTRLQTVGSSVTVRGIVINGPELGKIRYLQDGTAGIAVYPGAGSVDGFDGEVFPGDSIEVTGTMVSYHELLEITPITSFKIISTGNPLPTPKRILLSELSKEYESQLLEFECISFANAGGQFSNGGSYSVSSAAGDAAKVYLRSGHPMLGSDIPLGPVRLTVVLSIYDDFQLLPCSSDDFEPETCLFFSQKPVQNNIQTNGFTLHWETSLPANCLLHYGNSASPNQTVTVTGATAIHDYQFTNLNPGSIYWVQVEAQRNGEEVFSEPIPFATRSNSSGQIKTYFNHSIDPAFANGLAPAGQTDQAVVAETIARINAAEQTLDVAVYNNSQTDLTNALKAAHARGVKVRYVGALAASNFALNPAPAFPVLYGNEEAIMHHKFMSIDADLPDKAWVMSGSLNWTYQNIFTDFNNTLFIQDQSLAKAYRIEFEEMWGSSGLQPDVSESRFGSAKRDNTPHQFMIGGQLVESYFSPSDLTTSHIESALKTAQSEALFATFSFTKNELGNALVDLQSSGVPVRGIMENISDNGAEYNHLLANDVAVRHHNMTGEFHHKYAVVDAYDWTSDPTVITGSHNWSVAAETVNDENTLILHDPLLATLYKAEFEKRWSELSTSGVKMIASYALQVFPNPASDWLELRGLPEEPGAILIKNTLGQCLYSAQKGAEKSFRVPLSELDKGQFFVTFISAHVIASVPFQKI